MDITELRKQGERYLINSYARKADFLRESKTLDETSTIIATYRDLSRDNYIAINQAVRALNLGKLVDISAILEKVRE